MPPPLALAVLPPSLLLLLLTVAGLLVSLAAPVQATTSAALFCKCTCLTNSTIIPLPLTMSCNGCTRQFCLNYRLPICKSAKEEEVATTCFRNSPLSPPLSLFPLTHSGDQIGLLANCGVDVRLCVGGRGGEFTERDSVKDQAVVYIFIVATLGLLLWALVKPWLARRRAGYAAVPG